MAYISNPMRQYGKWILTVSLQPRPLARFAALDLGLLQGLGHLVEGGEGDVNALEDRADVVVLETLGHAVVPVIAHPSPSDLELLHRFLHPTRCGDDVSRVHEDR